MSVNSAARKSLTRHGSLKTFFALTWIWFQIVAFGYWWHSLADMDVLSIVFIMTAFAAVIGVLLLPFALISQLLLMIHRNFGRVVALVTMTTLSLLMVLDWNIFNQMHFHLNGAVWAIATSKEGLATLNLTSGVYIAAAALVLIVLSVEALMMTASDRGGSENAMVSLIGRSLTSARCSQIWLLAMTIQSVIYIYADSKKIQSISELALRVPFYQPIEVRSYTQGFMTANAQPSEAASLRKGNFQYPPNPPTMQVVSDLPDIFIVVLDSWRSDMLDGEVSPNLNDFSQSATHFNNHYSGGNQTRHGIFSLFYGIPASYWKVVLANRKSPVLIDVLLQQGYDIQVFSSSNLAHPEFRETAFVRLSDAQIHDRPEGDNPAAKDITSTNAFLKFVNKKSSQPKFGFLFLDGSHGPYSYDQTKSRKFFPDDANYFISFNPNAEIDALKNRYKNSVYQADMTLGPLLDALSKKKKKPVVIITGDHGEEFLEHGFRGHCSAFTDEQVKVPLIVSGLRLNNEALGYSHMTTHVDVVFSLIEKLGVEQPSEFTVGRSIYDHGREQALSCGWDQCAVISKDHVTIFGTESYNAMKLDMLDGRYNKFTEAPQPSPYLHSAVREMAKFY